MEAPMGWTGTIRRAGAFVAAAAAAVALAITQPGAALASGQLVYVSQFGGSGSGNGQFNEPLGVAVDPNNGDVYVADRVNARVEKFDSNGNYMSQFGSYGTGNGQFHIPLGLGVDPGSGDVYVTDSNDRVEKFDSNGNYLSKFGSYGSGNGQFVVPEGVAVDRSNGDVYVADLGNNRVEKWDSSGTYLSSFGSYGSGNGQFNEPAGVAVGDGEVYVGDVINNRVEKFDSNGAYVSQFGSTGSGNGQFDQPQGVAVDPNNGDVYVVDTPNNRVEQFDSNGNYLSQFGSYGSGNGQFENPADVAVDPRTDDVYVSDESNDRVEKFGAPIVTMLTARPQFVFFPPPSGAGWGTVSATLTATGSPVAGQAIAFSVGGTPLCSAVTDSSGTASCSPSALGEQQVLLNNSYTATFPPSGSYLGSTASTPAFEVGNGLVLLFGSRAHISRQLLGTLTRAGKVYGWITSRTRRGRLSLRFKAERQLRAGHYVLAMHVAGREIRRTLSIK
jgi:DNA-binding beta-propeller fold protein YncE